MHLCCGRDKGEYNAKEIQYHNLKRGEGNTTQDIYQNTTGLNNLKSEQMAQHFEH